MSRHIRNEPVGRSTSRADVQLLVDGLANLVGDLGVGMIAATSITVRAPLTIRRRGGRKAVLSPYGSVMLSARRQVTTSDEPTLVKALERAFRCQKLLDNGAYASISDIARAEKLHRTFVGDILRLTLLAPNLVEAILEGRQPDGMTLPALMKPFPFAWMAQSDVLEVA